jgi:hypothetical protein
MLEETKYLLIINMYVGNGYVETGRFYIGNDQQEANELFTQLTGEKIITHKVLLRLDLISQNQQGLDTVLGNLGCTLGEMSENVKIILKETFRMLNLE